MITIGFTVALPSHVLLLAVARHSVAQEEWQQGSGRLGPDNEGLLRIFGSSPFTGMSQNGWKMDDLIVLDFDSSPFGRLNFTGKLGVEVLFLRTQHHSPAICTPVWVSKTISHRVRHGIYPREPSLDDILGVWIGFCHRLRALLAERMYKAEPNMWLSLKDARNCVYEWLCMIYIYNYTCIRIHVRFACCKDCILSSKRAPQHGEHDPCDLLDMPNG